MKTTHHIMQSRKCPFILLGLASLLAGGPALAEMRIWEDTSGLSVKAEFVREIFEAVELRRPDGSLYSIPLEKLSKLDTDYLRSRIPPDVTLNVRKQKRSKIRNEDFVRNGDVINVVTIDVEVSKKSRAPFTGTLRAEIYLIGKEVATDPYRLSGRKTARVQFTEENEDLCTLQASADFRVYEEYNGLETRGAEYAGYLVVILDPMGNRLAVDTDLSWLKDEKIDALRKLRVGSFFDENCRKRSVPRPRYYDSRFEF